MMLFLYLVIGVITFIAFLHAWSRKSYDLHRTIVINCSKAEVFAFIRQLKKQPLWMPWLIKDNSCRKKYKGADGKLGAVFYWQGSNRVEGIQKITKVYEGKLLETHLVFVKPFRFWSMTYFAVKEIAPEKTKMVWGVKGVHKFPTSILFMCYGLDRALGKDFENGLHSLKKILEKATPETRISRF